MNKKIKQTIVGALTVATIASMSSVTAFAAPAYTNSTGSAVEDIKIIEDEGYTVAGQDTTQNKKSTYTQITLADDTKTSPCEVYATIAEGSKVYDPDNPKAGEDGFVDGSVVVSLPTTLILSGSPTDDGYYVGTGVIQAKGNIAGTSVINVVPDAEVTLSQTGKNDITASVSSEYTKFVLPTSTVTGSDVNKHLDYVFNDECKSTVTVKTNQATAGSWSGSYNNTISLTKAA